MLLLATSPRPARWHPGAIGALAGLGFLARYVDGAWLMAIALVAIVLTVPRGRTRIVALAAAVLAALLVALPNLWVATRYYGDPLRTPYASRAFGGGTEQGLDAYSLRRVPESATGELISPYLFGKGQPGSDLLEDMWWVVFLVPGSVVLARGDPRRRAIVLVTLGASLVATVFYLNFHGSGAGVVKFGALHYLKMWWPVWGILAAAGFVWIAQGAAAVRTPTAGS